MRKHTMVWGGVVAFWFIGDIVTTYYGLKIGLVEANPAARQVISNGFGFIIFAKVLTTGLVYANVWATRNIYNMEKYDIVSPIMLAFMGLAITCWNSYLILTF